MKIEPGDFVKDRITGFTGIVTCRTEWLNKCVRVSVQPRELKDGKPIEAQGFDVEQLELVEKAAVTIDKEKTGGDRDYIVSAPVPPSERRL